VRYEEGAMPVTPGALLYSFSTDPATRRGHDSLALPIAEYLEGPGRGRLDPPSKLFDAEATAGALSLAFTQSRPALVLTMSHGIECFRAPGRRDLWGALTDSTFGGGGAHPFDAARVPAEGPFAPGAVVLCFACFSAGVPAESAYDRLPGAPGEAVAGAPFTSPLPRALLAHAEGPVAFYGHVDRATTYSFKRAGEKGPAAFRDFVAWAREGGTLGQAMSTFSEMHGDAADSLARVLADARRRPDAAASRAVVNAWIRYHDAAGYVLLGDPALRLALPRG
jgi:hypothetical protein